MLLLFFAITVTASAAKKDTSFRYVDLTHKLDKETVRFGNPPFQLSILTNFTVPGLDGWYKTEIMTTAVHMGTHLDAPCFFAPDKWCVHEIPVERLILPAAVVDISDRVGDDPSVHLSPEDLVAWEREHGPIPQGCLLLIHTGWARHYLDHRKYAGCGTGNFSFPSVSPEAAAWLAAERDIYGIGIDSLSIDASDADFGTHRHLMPKNVFGLENLAGLDRLPPLGALVFAMPIKLKGSTGAPARVVARVPSPF